MLQTGQSMPDFALMSDTAGEISAQALRGTRYIIFVYPKDDTYG